MTKLCLPRKRHQTLIKTIKNFNIKNKYPDISEIIGFVNLRYFGRQFFLCKLEDSFSKLQNRRNNLQNIQEKPMVFLKLC